MKIGEINSMNKRIIYIPSLQYECYFLGNGWKIVKEDKIRNIYIDSFYGYPFYIIFEHIEIICKQLTMLISKYSIVLSDIFPIELMVKDMVDHQQGYWLDLCIDFIIKMNCLNEGIANILTETKYNKKGFDQKLRNKIRKMILLNNYKY
ncbi:hypothetical protein HNP38_003606 [Chryseobacterium defluvii]|uniref:Uncharacterized protein n=1 Tax=Chryseobacterium defluvii TaxID=160396 RepID=A0A840KKV1_9FLAO|nr:hypothetical protein [Chryseobacterium defluvii]MBB4808264.1 hypothetical protein [Chryseobacterium defluvii]